MSRVARIYIAVEIENADGSLSRYEAMGQPERATQHTIDLEPHHGPLGDAERVEYSVSGVLVPIEGEPLYVTTEVPAHRVALDA